MLNIEQEIPGGVVEGHCDPHFQEVVDEFVGNFTTRNEVGASLCLTHEGHKVVDVWGGQADASEQVPWRRDTVSVIFSCTKAATALCAHLLHQRGQLDLDAPVADVWPEFASNGKQSATTRMMLDHSVGLPGIREPLKSDCLTDWDYMTERLAAEQPFWEPGTRNGYHALTFGFTVGEVVRRVSGKSLGTFFQDEVAGPLDLDFWIGLPEEQEYRVAPMIPYRPGPDTPSTPFMEAAKQPGTIANLFLFNHGDWAVRGVNTRPGRAAEIGAAGGISNARGLAEFYTALSGNDAIVFPDTLAAMTQASVATHVDATLLVPTRFSAGFMLSMDNRHRAVGRDSVILGQRAFGHVGAGGSLGFTDLECGLSFGYTMNRMGEGLFLNERGQSLVDAAYRCLGYRSNKAGYWMP